MGGAAVWKPYVVKNTSCEGMAEHLYEVFNQLVRQATKERAFVTQIEITEDSKNSATFAAGRETEFSGSRQLGLGSEQV